MYFYLFRAFEIRDFMANKSTSATDFDVTKFKFKENTNYNIGATFNKGTVILAGTKIKF